MKNVEVSLSKGTLKQLLTTGIAFATCLSLCAPVLLHASEDEEVKDDKVVYAISGDATKDPVENPSGDPDEGDMPTPTNDAVNPSGDATEEPSGDPEEDITTPTNDPEDQVSGDATSDLVDNDIIVVTGDVQTDGIVDTIKSDKVKEPSINFVKNDQIVTKEIFAAVKETGKPLTLTVMGQIGTAYTIEFAKVENANVDFPLKVEISNTKKVLNTEVPKGSNVVEFNFAHHGDLPGVAQVIAPIDGLGIKDGKVFVYYVNEETKQLELISKEATVKDSIVRFSITHCSKYVVSDKALVEETKEPDKEVVKPVAPVKPTAPAKPSGTKPTDKDSTIKDTSHSTNNVVPVLAGIVMLAGAGLVVLRKQEN